LYPLASAKSRNADSASARIAVVTSAGRELIIAATGPANDGTTVHHSSIEDA